MKPNFKIVSAPPGNPSILWYGKSGNVYRNVVDAKIDNPLKAWVDNIDKKTETTNTKVAVKSNAIIVYVIVFVVVAFIVYKILK